MTTPLMELDLWLNIFDYEGRPAAQIRKTFLDENFIRKLINMVAEDGEIEIKGKIQFKDPLSAKIKLRRLGLL